MPSSSLGAQGTPLSLISELIKLEAKLCCALWSSMPRSHGSLPCTISGLQLARSCFPRHLSHCHDCCGETLTTPFHQSHLKLGSREIGFLYLWAFRVHVDFGPFDCENRQVMFHLALCLRETKDHVWTKKT